MKKRIFSLLCVFVLLIGLLPSQALAYVGAIRTTEEESAAVTTSRITYGGVQYLVLQNDYITFAVQTTGSGSVLRSYTVPTAQLNSNNDIFRFPAETNRFYLGNQEGFQNAGQLQIKSISGQVENLEDENRKMLYVSLTFTDSRLDAVMNFWLDRVNKGTDTGTSDIQPAIYKDLSEAGNHWSVVSYTSFRMTSTDTSVQDVGYPHHVKEYPLASMGHRNVSATAPLMLSVAEEMWGDDPWLTHQQTNFYPQNITAGLGYSQTYNRVEYEVPVEGVTWTRTKAISTYYTEVYTNNYLAANPFVGLSSFNKDALDAANSHGVEGHHWFLPDYVSSDGRTVTTYSPGERLWNVDFQHVQTVCSLWGFRDLYAKGDTEAPTQPDKVEVELNADKLAILRSSTGVLTVQPYDSDQGLSAVKALYPNYTHVATLRGNYKTTTKVADNPFAGLFSWWTGYTGGNTIYTYEFTDGAAALSPTVTATWGSGGSFSITSDGKITHSGLSLSAPTFKFYAPRDGGGLTLGFDADGLTMGFEPEKNSAIFSLDIPHATTQVAMGYADKDGNLRFTGEMSISTLFDGATFDMEELGYGLKNGSFTVNGVRATGSFDTAKLIGLDLAEVEGSINTFAGQESYGFDVSLDLFSLVKAKAELELKRLKSNGALIPDDLYLYVGGSALPVLTVVPTIPVAQITGGGLGFYNLADTINGDYYAIPPITMRGTVKGKYVQLFTGTTDTVIGPGAFEFTASDIKIAGMESLRIIEEAGLGLYIGGQRVNYNGTEYSGMRFAGKANLEAGLPSVSENWLKLNAGVAVGLFGGLNNANTQLYVQASGNSHINAELQFPDDWAIIGGMNLLGAGVDIVVGGQTVIPVSGSIGNGFSGAFNNMKLYLGAMGQASLLGCNARVWVILPKSAATGDWWDFTFKVWKSLPAWSWDGKIQGLRTTSQRSAPASRLLSAPASTSQTVNVNVTNETDSAYLVLAFDSSITEAQLKEHLRVTDPNGSQVNLVWLSTDADGNITNADTANVSSGVVARSDGTGNDHVALIYLGKGTGYNGDYTITTQDAASGQSLFAASSSKVTTLNSTDLSFTAQAAAINVEPDELGPVRFSGNTVTGSVANPEAGVTYVVRTYLSSDPDSADYLVDEQVLDDTTSFSIPVPATGTAAPSGSYYVTTYLMRQETGDFDGDGTVGADEVALLGIGNASSESRMTYTNSMQPGQVQTVTLTATGNETMQASWSQVDDADGYRITIYHADGTDTGLGYEYDVSQFSGEAKMAGLNLDNGTFSIDMAMTAGGATTEDGTPITLDAGQEYKVGVTAYRSETIGEQTAKYYGIEKQSEAKMLPEYAPLDMTIMVNYEPLTADENGIYQATFHDTGSGLTVEAPEGVDATFTATRMDTGAALEERLYGGGYIIPTVDGTLMLSVTGSVTHDGVTDTTTRYVLVSRDDTPPILTLDEEVFYADPSTRTYTITGVTEPGATVTMAGPANEWDYADIITTTAAADGSFSLTSTLAPDNDGIFQAISSTDAAGNEATNSAMITLLTEYPVHFDANGGSGTMPDDTAAFGASYTLPPCDFTPPQGKQFQAWATSTDGTTVYEPGDSVLLEADTTFYALWEDIPHTHVGVLHTGYPPTCDTEGEKDYYTCSCNKFFEDAACTKEITNLETWKVIPATGHKLTKTEAKAPTCTQAGNKEHWTCKTCGKYFGDETATTELQLSDVTLPALGHSQTEVTNAKAATCTQEGYTGDIVCTVCGEVVEPGQVIAKLAHDYQGGKCTVCGSLDPAFQPEIIAGANGTWQQGSRDPLSFTSNAAYDDFRKVQVDGKDLAPSNYTVKEGSTIVSLNAAYLETLSVGKHTLSVVSQTGTATTEFTIQAPPATGGDSQSPQTNDSSHLALWLGVLASCGILLSAGLWYNRRRNEAKHQ